MTDVAISIVPPPDVVVTIGDVSSVSLLYSGMISMLMTAGETFNYGEIGYIKQSDGKIYKAKANGTAAEAEAQVICAAAAGVLIDVSGLFAAQGFLSGLSGGTNGMRAFLSTTYGASTTAAPSANFSKNIGRWISSTLLWFSPDWVTAQLS